ncbi:hypothetical protein SLEP1_g7243 [Rubroshorea leprosula]|uniref:Laccase n=1 Tax=Rubroshorea leprosula TaxID=152421 RepID=A0AAV5HXS5_9ROSI|nr:hypothetical protein SLEP1_g7243 [Rubroshorea leprosula]
MGVDPTLIEICGANDSLLQNNADDAPSYFSCSPFHFPRSKPPLPNEIEKLKSNANRECASVDKENVNNANKSDAAKLSMEPQQMKRKKKGGGYNLRKLLKQSEEEMEDDPSLIEIYGANDSLLQNNADDAPSYFSCSPFHFPRSKPPLPNEMASWYNEDVNPYVDYMLKTGTELLNAAEPTIRMKFEYGKTHLLRLVNALMNRDLFFMIAGHNLTVVGSDTGYVKPVTKDYIFISTGQTLDILATANQKPGEYYMIATPYFDAVGTEDFDNSTASAIFQYTGNYTQKTPYFPVFVPNYADMASARTFVERLRSLASEEHPIEVPMEVDTRMFTTISANLNPCPNDSCAGPDGGRILASLNNISFVNPAIDILEAYYRNISGIYETDFPDIPPVFLNFTGDDLLTPNYILTKQATTVKVWVFTKTTLSYNLVDPPQANTIVVPNNGWATVSFRADNPGVWLMHCHFERHLSWGMAAVFIVKNGDTAETSFMGPPANLPPWPDGGRILASLNNISFVNPAIDILEAYYRNISGIYETDFPDIPPVFFNFTGDDLLTPNYILTKQATTVKVWVFTKTTLSYNLVDPPQANTIVVPNNGWATVRFRADNPGVWLMHCHFERHLSWGMAAVFIVKNGDTAETSVMGPPANLPPCKYTPLLHHVFNSTKDELDNI